jgi:hypothetical protein
MNTVLVALAAFLFVPDLSFCGPHHVAPPPAPPRKTPEKTSPPRRRPRSRRASRSASWEAYFVCEKVDPEGAKPEQVAEATKCKEELENRPVTPR